MEILEQLYEGKAKKVFKTADKDVYMVQYKDDATAFNGAKKGSISEKGIVNNKMSNKIMQQLEQAGIPTHYIEQLSDRETLVKRVKLCRWRLLCATSPPAALPNALAWRRAGS